MKNRITDRASKGKHQAGVAQRRRKGPLARTLEPRFMFDAAGLATGVEVSADTTAQAQAEAALDSAQTEQFDPSALGGPNEGDRLLAALTGAQSTSGTTEIVFVDTSVNDYETLLAGIDPGAEVVLLDANGDGLEQIADILDGRTGISAIHIISHGDAGELNLGTATLTQESMQGEYADELALIGGALGEAADILIYGCNFAEGIDGQHAADTLAGLTGADVAASTDLSGHADFGADWELEHQSGDIETTGVISELAQQQWRGLLIDTDGDTIDNAIDIDDDNDGVLDADEGAFDVMTVSLETLTIDSTTNPPTPVPTGAPFQPIEIAPVGGGAGTTTTTLDLTSTGVSVGDTVTISNILANGDMNSAGETFSLDIGGVTATGLQTGSQAFVYDPLTAPISLEVLVVDIGAGTPGIVIDSSITAEVDDFNGDGWGVRFTFDLSYFVAAATPTDTDADGVPDYLDLDSDNDGITDNVEAQATEAYAVPTGVDANGDGLLDIYDAGAPGIAGGIGLAPVDSDGDGIADLLDDDSDRDGTPDIAERGDGQATSIISTTDSDGDGLLNIFENGTFNDGYDVNDDNVDDSPLVFNLGDADEDLDPDGGNASGLITNLDFRENAGTDFDGDGVSNTIDIDADNDGILDSVEGAITQSFVERATGIIVPYIILIPVGGGEASDNVTIDLSSTGLTIGETVTVSNVYADGDLNSAGETFSLTFNSDPLLATGQIQTGDQNNGATPTIVDLPTAFVPIALTVIDIGGGTPGINVDAASTAAVDILNGAGYGVRIDIEISYSTETSTRDTDSDGAPDYLDIDSDNDGITDTVEAQATANYIFPAGTDGDGDGLDDNFDAVGGLTPINTDTVDNPDYLDNDSDGDGIDDIVERGDGAPTSLTSTVDTDGDGLLDIFEGGDLTDIDINDENLVGLNFNLADTDLDAGLDGTSASPPLADFDYREDQSADIDGDGIANNADLDADNDGILNTDEVELATISSPTIDLGDGPDNVTVGIDLSGTGLILGDTVRIFNIRATGDINNGGETFTLTFDRTGDPGFVTPALQTGNDYGPLTLVNPNNSYTDVEVTDIGGGTPGITVDVQTTGTVDQSGASPYGVRLVFEIEYSTSDSDGDGIDNYVDIDSDNDGITDNVEAQTTQGYVAPSGNDGDNDGLDDSYDPDNGGNTLVPADTDSDGTADFLDADSDNDGRGDITERGDGQPLAVASSTTDTDGDGLLDIFEGLVISDTDANDENLNGVNFNLADTDDDTDADGSNADPGAIPSRDLDYRDILDDTDGDGIVDANDIDADNDGILNTVEGSDLGGTLSASTGAGAADPYFELLDNQVPITENVSLAGTGLSIGDTVTVSNIRAIGDLDADASVEFFRLNFNDGEYLTGNLQTGFEHGDYFDAGDEPITLDSIPAPSALPAFSTQLSTPVSVQLTVIDIGTPGNVIPGIRFKANAPVGVNELGGLNFAVRFDFEVSWSAPDFDKDGIADWLDIDSDNDGITDNVEAQTTQAYIAPSGTGTGITDTAGGADGLDDNYDPGSFGTSGHLGLAPVDTDGDGITDQFDNDSDGDGIEDIAERGDGQPRSLFSITDTDADGLLDIFEGSNVFDIDANDENLTGGNFNLADGDNDTLADGSDAMPLLNDLDYRDLADTDGDGIPDADDLDADNDGILNVDEGLTAIPGSLTTAPIEIQPGGAGSETVTNIDLSSTGLVIGDTVTISNVLADGDLDRTNGDNERFRLVFNTAEATVNDLFTGSLFEGPEPVTNPVNLELTVIDIDPGPGVVPGIIVTSREQGPVGDDYALGYAVRFTFDIDWSAPDTDGDGVFDYLDLDSDNDGISDLYESGASAAVIAADTNFDGTLSFTEGGGDADSDGILNIFETTPTTIADTDGDGVDNVLDLDSDNDGIADAIEFRPTAGFQPNDGDVRNDDADGDGIIDIYDSNDNTTGNFGGSFNAAANDADSDGTPDYLDSDSDGDGINDTIESGFTLTGGDANLDGISDNASIGASYADPDGVVTTTSPDLPNAVGTDLTEIAFRESDLVATDETVPAGVVNESSANTLLAINLLANDTLSGISLLGTGDVVTGVSSAVNPLVAVPAGGVANAVTITTALGGLATVSSDGLVQYNPNNQAIFNDLNFGDASVVDSFSYTITSGGLTDSATFYITVGPNNELVGSASDTIFQGAAANDQSGFQVTALGDINGDGYDDVAIGAVTASPNGETYAGESYVLFGKPGGFGATYQLGTLSTGGGVDGFVIRGIDARDLSSRGIAGGDVNGDGLADIIIGSPRADTNGNAAGEVHVVFGDPAVGATGSLDLSTLDGTDGFVLNGIAADDNAGRWVSFAGDVNGDGLGDFLIGAPFADPNGLYSGETYLIYGKADFTSILTAGVFELLDLSDPARNPAGVLGTVFNGAAANDNSGNFVAGNGDFNGDGLQDIVIGAYSAGTNYQGASYLIYGKSVASGNFGAGEFELSSLGIADGFALTGELGSDFSGKSVALAGDINGDGFDDLVVAAPYASPNTPTNTYTGTSYIIYGGNTSLAASQTVASVADVSINGVKADNAGTGFTLAYADDINGDGYDDLIIGRAPFSGIDSGAAYLVFGSDTLAGTIELDSLTPLDAGTSGGASGLTVTTGFVVSGLNPNDYAGQIVSSAGDVNGDGFDDIIVGAYTAMPNGNIYAGESYLIYGKDYRQETPISGTAGVDALSGTAADEVLIAGDNNDTLDGGAGNDILIGGNGDDTLIYDASDISRIDGGGGTDTLAVNGSGKSLDLTGINNNRYQDIEFIDLTGSGGNALKLSTLDLLALSGSTNILTIDGNSDDFVEVTTGLWAQEANDGNYKVYTNGEATLKVDLDVPILIPLASDATSDEGQQDPVEADQVMMVAGTSEWTQESGMYSTPGLLPFTQQIGSAQGLFEQQANALLDALVNA